MAEWGSRSNRSTAHYDVRLSLTQAQWEGLAKCAAIRGETVEEFVSRAAGSRLVETRRKYWHRFMGINWAVPVDPNAD